MINSNSLGKTGTQVVKKLVFLFVFALVALAYVVTPLTAFAACPGGGGGGGGGGGAAAGGNAAAAGIGAATRRQQQRQQQQQQQQQQQPQQQQQQANGSIGAITKISSTNLRQILVVLKTGTLQFVDTTGNIVNFGTLRPGQVFEITASDATNNIAQNVSAKLLGKTLALITLPRNIQQQVFFANIQSPCLSSQTFPINLAGSTTPQIGRCLDKNSASVTIPGSNLPTTIVFPQSPEI